MSASYGSAKYRNAVELAKALNAFLREVLE